MNRSLNYILLHGFRHGGIQDLLTVSMNRYLKYILLLGLLVMDVNTFDVVKCCSETSSYDLESKTCRKKESTEAHFTKFPPTIFSLETGGAVTENITVTKTEIPNCTDGEDLTVVTAVGPGAADLALIKDDGSLYIGADTSQHSSYCMDDIEKLGQTIGLVALTCRPDPCSGKICVRSCGTKNEIYEEASNTFRNLEKDESVFSPSFSDRRQNKVNLVDGNDVVLIHGPPSCDRTIVYSGIARKEANDVCSTKAPKQEYHLQDDGQIYVGEHNFNHSRYCLRDTVDNMGTRVTDAVVCDHDSVEKRSVVKSLSDYIVPSLLFISEVFLLITFILHVIVPDFRKQIFGWMKMSTVASLFFAYLWLLTIMLSGPSLFDYTLLCPLLGFLMQYCFLAAFFWMSAMAIEVWSTFKQLRGSTDTDIRLRTQHRRFVYYNLYAWGGPAIISLVTIIIHLLPRASTCHLVTPGLGVEHCFFSTNWSKLFYFHGIIGVLLAANLVFYLASAYTLLFGIWASSGDSSGRQNTRQMLGIVVELFLVMGLTWSADIISWSVSWRLGRTYVGWETIILDSINSLQGILIFIVLVSKPRMRGMIRQHISPALKFFHSKPFDVVDSPTKQGTTTPNTKSTMYSLGAGSPGQMGSVSQGVVGSPSQAIESISRNNQSSTQVKRKSSSGVFDSLTPSWKRGSYNLAFHKSEYEEAEDEEALSSIKTISIAESKC